METKVLYGYVEQEEVIQHIFIKLTEIGQMQGKKIYKEERISFSFGRAERLFPLLKDKVESDSIYYKNEILSHTPLVVNKSPDREVIEDCLTYKYYMESFKETSIPFSMVNYLFENYNSMRTMFNSILEMI